MANYKLTNKAVADLSKIWEYTFKIYPEKQADKYYNDIISSCQDIEDAPELGKNYPGIKDQLLGMQENKHIICYRTVKESYIEILRILHERIDLKNRIAVK